MPELLTRLNPYFKRPTIAENELDCSDIGVPSPNAPYAQFLRDSLAPSTQTQYLHDLRAFAAWGGTLPATPEQIASYAAYCAGQIAIATLVRRLAALSKTHNAKGFANPVRTELVRSTLRGIKRTHGTAQKEAAPLLKEDLFDVLGHMGERPKDIRDRTVLLLGFAAALRRSELVALNHADIEQVRQGMIIYVRRSKTDQLGEGRQIGIAHGRTRWCPVKALAVWLMLSEITDGPIFRRVDRHGNIMPERMAGEAVSLVVKERTAAAGLDAARYSGHSLRAGLVTSAAMSGIASWAIRKTTGHRSEQMLGRYIRSGDLFTDNAAGALL